MSPEIRDIFLKYGDFEYDMTVIDEQEIADLVGVCTIGIQFNSVLDLIGVQLNIHKDASEEEKEILRERAIVEIKGSLLKGLKAVIY